MVKILSLLITFWLIAFWAFPISFSSAQASETCPKKINPEEWISLVLKTEQRMENSLRNLKPCIKKSAALQLDLDTLAVRLLHALDKPDTLDKLDESDRRRYAGLIKQTLKINADLGFDSSQHNLAVLYNYDPRSRLAILFERDFSKFAYWTHKAASQGEPKSMFNVAVRLASEKKVEGFSQDKELAYIIFLEIDKYIEKFPKQFLYIKPHTEKSKSMLRDTLGNQKIEHLMVKSKNFDLSTLSPD